MGRRDPGDASPPRRRSWRGLGRAVALTAASALVWGVAHLAARRRVAGVLLMALFAALAGGAAFAVLRRPGDLRAIALRRDGLTAVMVGLAALGAFWAAVVIRSYQVVRPRRPALGARLVGGAAAAALAAAVCAPPLWAARGAHTLREAIDEVFPDGAGRPWTGGRRVNVLLLGGDGARSRPGIRTDSVTLASIDTRTGNTVLFGLPRNLQRFPMPPDLRWRWPDGFTGYPGGQGLLNELYQDAEDHPDLVPGRPAGQRGPRLVAEVVAGLLGQPVDYYVFINMFGLADLVDAVGGVRVHITRPLPIGGDDAGRAPTGWLWPGHRLLHGRDALWFARSRRADSDYARMSRQKCLLWALARRADARTVLTRLRPIVAAVKRTVRTDLPAGLLPVLARPAGGGGHRARIRSLMFVPPLIGQTPYRPDVGRIQGLVADALRDPARPRPGPARSPGPRAGAATGGPAGSLDALCR